MNDEAALGSLRQAAEQCCKSRKRPVHVGAAVMPDYLNAHYDPYAETLNREFNRVVAEHHMKWKPLLVDEKEGVYDFAQSDKVVNWALQHGMTVKGHTLCWHIMTPDFAEKMSATRLREALYEHIRTTMRQFQGRVESWDVVNEAFSYDCSGSMEQNVFFRKLGPSYVDDCFRVAHEADPNAKLIYNDNKVEGAGLPHGRSKKADAMYEMLKGMKERGVPVHGAGMQAHFDAAGTGLRRPPTPHSVRRNVRRLGELGLTVNISEMDVRVADLPADVDKAAAQASIYGDTITACLSEDAFDGLTLWGFTDQFSWVHEFYKPDTPLPWDDTYRPKPAVHAIRNALLHSAAEGHIDAERSEGDHVERQGGHHGSRMVTGTEALAMPEHLWGQEWMVPEPGEHKPNRSTGQGGSEKGTAVDTPNWEARNHP